VAVIGVPDIKRGQIVKAFILPNIEPNQNLKEDIQNFVKKKLSKHEYPREIEFVKSLPKTAGGKINKAELKKWRASIDT
jgi:acetyl-CoA synthetase